MGNKTIFYGIVIFLVVWMLKDRVPYIGNLPGDFLLRFRSVHLFIPFTSCLLVGLGISLLRGIFSGR
jgi:hypothetical protein